VDITATWPKKIEALQCYNKQWERDAYGDLQNGNVIINRRPCLIDYDGVYVPGLSVGQGTELDHKHFQHPKRSTAAFGPEMDRFSFIVIDLSLNALIEQPSLIALPTRLSLRAFRPAPDLSLPVLRAFPQPLQVVVQEIKTSLFGCEERHQGPVVHSLVSLKVVQCIIAGYAHHRERWIFER
jgi:hypothetical protein